MGVTWRVAVVPVVVDQGGKASKEPEEKEEEDTSEVEREV